MIKKIGLARFSSVVFPIFFMVKTSGGDGRQESRKRSNDSPKQPRKATSNPVESVFARRKKARNS